MIIVLEGTDLSGKSTLARKLTSELRDPHLVKCSAPKPNADPYLEYEHVLYPHIDAGHTVICDRLHVGERVYGPLVRGVDRLGVAGWRHVELFLAAHGALVVHCTQPEAELLHRYTVRGDAHRTLEEIIKARRSYLELEGTGAAASITVSDSEPDTVDRIIRLAAELAGGSTWSIRPHDPYDSYYVGQPRPKALLFGERRREERDRSAFVPRKATSGRYLLEHLPDPYWKTIGLTNACEDDSDPYEVWNDRGRPPVVALGSEAHNALVKASVPHSSVPHPQFIRRFHHGELDVYGQLIEKVTGLDQDFRRSWRGEAA